MHNTYLQLSYKAHIVVDPDGNDHGDDDDDDD